MELISIHITAELKHKLSKIDNYSQLIRDLLVDYFETNESSNLLKAKKEDIIRESTEKIKKLDKKIEEIESKEEELKKEKEREIRIKRIQEACENGDEDLALQIARGEE